MVEALTEHLDLHDAVQNTALQVPENVFVLLLGGLLGRTAVDDGGLVASLLVERPDLPREEFVKRIVGLPGDHIEFRTDGVHLNGVPMATQRLSESFEDPGGRDLDILEASVGDRSFQILDDPHTDFRPRVRSVTVPPGRYLVLGDNRDHSKDSRVWGTVRMAEIKGPAFVLYWSWDFNGSWVEVLNPLTWWNAEKRWDRVGNSVR